MDASEDDKLETGWTCPRCGRRFSEPQAVHECTGRDRAEYAATTLFSSSAPQVYDLFLRLVERVASQGGVEVKVERAQIDFCDGKVFTTVRAERDVMLVGLIFADLDNQPRFVSIEQLEDGTWLHTLKVSKEKDLNGELAGWLERAHREMVAPRDGG
jgi:hypothetical protein